MKPRLVIVFLLALSVPVAASAQARLLVGGGLSSPHGDAGDLAGTGFHLNAGLQLTVAALPVSIRGDGAYHRLGAPESGFEKPTILAGSVSLVYTLPGVAIQPYVLAGFGSYRTEAGPVDETVEWTDTGFHGGFGVNMGTGGLQFFAEVRYIQVDHEQTLRLIPLTVGLRF